MTAQKLHKTILLFSILSVQPILCSFSNQTSSFDIQSKIDSCHEKGGGSVIIAPGRYFDIKPIVLKSNVELCLEEGAMLYASTNYSDYAYMPGWNRGAFISAVGATNVAITGKGVIECSGDRMPHVEKTDGRWRGIHFTGCRNVRLEDFTLRSAHSWGCYLQECDGVEIRRIVIFNHANYNNDGLDIASKNVLVEDCDIDAEDDALVFKNHNPEFVVENVAVRRCRLSSNTSFVKIGTETWGGFRNIRVTDCELDCRVPVTKRHPYIDVPGLATTQTGAAGLSVLMVDGGYAEDIVYSRIKMKRGIMSPIWIRLDKRNENKDGKESYIRNVLIEDVEMDKPTTSYIPSSITGASGLRPRNIIIRRVKVRPLPCTDIGMVSKNVPEKRRSYPGCRMFKCVLPASGFYLRHSDDIKFEDFSVQSTEKDVRDIIVAEDSIWNLDGARR